jgi:UDP-N-acetyl-D-mannosaminuronic acid dehydrogenase
LITRDVLKNQYHNLDDFLNDVDIVVIMVGHEEIKSNFDKLKKKIILDTRHIYPGECYHL